jgi:hypothetical protein
MLLGGKGLRNLAMSPVPLSLKEHLPSMTRPHKIMILLEEHNSMLCFHIYYSVFFFVIV